MQAKLCGMKTLAAARAAEAAGANFIGFIFWPRSHRYVTPEAATEIAQGISRVKKVGVFVDEDIGLVNEIAARVGLDYVQLHGHEDAGYARQVASPVIKAYRYGEGFRPEEAAAFPAELVLLDSGAGGRPGGTGEAFAWREAVAAVAKVPGLAERLLIAGGVAKENLAAIEELFHPYGVDASGSLETNQEKDIGKIQEFMREVKRINSKEMGRTR